MIPSLYLTAKDRGIPMTQLVNTYIYRGLVTEKIPLAAYKKLPNSIQQSNYQIDTALELSKTVYPFKEIEEISNWYDSSIKGVGQALGVAYLNLCRPCHRKPHECNILWKYETAVLQLNQLSVDAMSHVLANGATDW